MQFGVYGAVIPIVLVYLMYVGFSASGSVLAGQAVGQLVGVSDSWGISDLCRADRAADHPGLSHHPLIGRVASVVGVLAFFLSVLHLDFAKRHRPVAQQQTLFASSFLLAISLSASWQIAFGPYVADYSRYLPASTSSLKTFLAVGLGSVVGSQISMVFRRVRGGAGERQFAGHEVSYIVGMGASGAMAALLYFCVVFGKVTITTLNAYGSFMSLATIVSGFAVTMKSRKPCACFVYPADGRFCHCTGLARAAFVPQGFLGIYPVFAGVFHALERDQPGGLLPDQQGALRRTGAV